MEFNNGFAISNTDDASLALGNTVVHDDEIQHLKNEIETLKSALKNAKDVENVHKECIQIAVDQITDLKRQVYVVDMTMIHLHNSFRNLEKRLEVGPKGKEESGYVENMDIAIASSATYRPDSLHTSHFASSAHSLYLENISMKKIIETLERGEVKTNETIEVMNLTIKTLEETVKTLIEKNQTLQEELIKKIRPFCERKIK